MGKIVWNPEWETGVPLIDEQHHRLLAEFNDFFEALHTDLHKRHVKNLLEFLVDFLDTHFEEEEQQMLATHYPGFVKHKAFHDALRSRVQKLVKTFNEGSPVVEAEIVAFVMDWMDNHISLEDKRMAKHLVQFTRKASEPSS